MRWQFTGHGAGADGRVSRCWDLGLAARGGEVPQRQQPEQDPDQEQDASTLHRSLPVATELRVEDVVQGVLRRSFITTKTLQQDGPALADEANNL